MASRHEAIRGVFSKRLLTIFEKFARMLLFTKHAVFTIEQLVCEHPAHHVAMKSNKVPALKVRCPICGAKPGEKCELSIGLPRTEPHRDRRLEAPKSKGPGARAIMTTGLHSAMASRRLSPHLTADHRLRS